MSSPLTTAHREKARDDAGDGKARCCVVDAYQSARGNKIGPWRTDKQVRGGRKQPRRITLAEGTRFRLRTLHAIASSPARDQRNSNSSLRMRRADTPRSVNPSETAAIIGFGPQK